MFPTLCQVLKPHSSSKDGAVIPDRARRWQSVALNPASTSHSLHSSLTAHCREDVEFQTWRWFQTPAFCRTVRLKGLWSQKGPLF